VSFNAALNSSPRSKFTANFHRNGLAGSYQILQDSVDCILIKYPKVPIRRDVFLQRLQLQAPLIRGIGRPVLGQIAVYSGRIISISYPGY
jgi:hypothetical protein